MLSGIDIWECRVCDTRNHRSECASCGALPGQDTYLGWRITLKTSKELPLIHLVAWRHYNGDILSRAVNIAAECKGNPEVMRHAYRALTHNLDTYKNMTGTGYDG